MSPLFDTPYYRVTKWFCSLVGMWPQQSRHRKRIIQSFNMLILFSYFPPQLRRLYNVWGKDLDAVCTCIPPIFTILVCLAKNITIIRFEPEMKMLLRQIETDWEITSREGEYKILVNYTLKARVLCIVYSAMLCNLLLFFIMTPTISPLLDILSPRNETRLRRLTFDLDYGIDLQTYWLWLWLHTCMTASSTIFNIVSADLLYVTLIIYSCCLFAIARYKLEHLAVSEHAMYSFENMSDYNSIYYSYHEDQRLIEEQTVALKECVISHEKAIKCAQLLHYIYTWSLFVTLGLNLSAISVSGIQLVSSLFQWAGMAMAILYIMGQLTHLFFLSLMAQFILDQSLNVHESAYSCYWYNMPTKFQKDVILILMRSRKPCKLIAGKLFVMSLENFCSILQTSMSYFAVLTSFR